jgi:hypothetical protein
LAEQGMMRKLLYFVGAGLTKSLQLPDKPVPLMCDYISVMANYVADDVILTTLAALELEEPYPYRWEDLESKELAKKLTGPNADRNLENRGAFALALKNKPSESIEDLLERASSTAAIRFIYAIDRLFYLVGWDVDFCPLDNFLRGQFKVDETHHTFVSFNYDLFLDRAVQKQTAGQWDVCAGYGFQIPWRINNDPPPMPGVGGVLPTENAVALNSSDSSSSRFQILKPHGSLNWLVPHKVPYVYSPNGLVLEDGKVIVPLTATRELRYWYKSDDFQYVCCGDELPSDVAPCIIAPVSAKSSSLSFIKETRSKVSQAIKDADEIYVLGWSMPKTDEDQERVIRCAVNERHATVERITVVNRGASPDYFERVASVFGVEKSQLRVFNSGFHEFAARHA